VREAVTKFLEFLLAQYFLFLAIRTPGHLFYQFRCLFARAATSNPPISHYSQPLLPR
jgi:hypothetical protein